MEDGTLLGLPVLQTLLVIAFLLTAVDAKGRRHLQQTTDPLAPPSDVQNPPSIAATTAVEVQPSAVPPEAAAPSAVADSAADALPSGPADATELHNIAAAAAAAVVPQDPPPEVAAAMADRYITDPTPGPMHLDPAQQGTRNGLYR